MSNNPSIHGRKKRTLPIALEEKGSSDEFFFVRILKYTSYSVKASHMRNKN